MRFIDRPWGRRTIRTMRDGEVGYVDHLWATDGGRMRVMADEEVYPSKSDWRERSLVTKVNGKIVADPTEDFRFFYLRRQEYWWDALLRVSLPAGRIKRCK
jgi:hypothetical protein